MVNSSGLIIHKADHKKGHRHKYNIYKKNRSLAQLDT
jgi:hypothetical protein